MIITRPLGSILNPPKDFFDLLCIIQNIDARGQKKNDTFNIKNQTFCLSFKPYLCRVMTKDFGISDSTKLNFIISYMKKTISKLIRNLQYFSI